MPPSTAWPSARQRSMPPARLATSEKPGLAQNHGRLRRAAAGAAHRDDRPVPRQFAGALGQCAQRDQRRAADMAERPGEFLRLAHIEDLHRRARALRARAGGFPRSRQSCSAAAPSSGAAGHVDLAVGLAALQIGRHRDIDLLRMRQPQVLHVAGEIGLADLAAEARVEVPLLARRWSRSGRGNRARDRAGSRPAGEKICSCTERYIARGSPCWKSVRPLPRISRQSPVKAMLRSSST